MSVLQHYSKTQGRCTNYFSVCDSKWLDFQMSRAPESISSYKQPRSGRIPVDFHQCSARFENHNKVGGCLGKFSLRQISLETGSDLPCTRTWLTTPLSTTIFSKKVPENLFFPQENTFFCLWTYQMHSLFCWTRPSKSHLIMEKEKKKRTQDFISILARCLCSLTPPQHHCYGSSLSSFQTF